MPGSGVELIDLVPVDEAVLAELLDVAVSDACPDEVMPPVDGEPGWTRARRDAFVAYHRSRRRVPGRPLAEITYAVGTDGRVVGAARLAARDDPLELEVGLWLARGARGGGIGTRVVVLAGARARELGARRLIACTTDGNGAALGALARQEFSIERSADGRVTAALPLA